MNRTRSCPNLQTNFNPTPSGYKTVLVPVPSDNTNFSDICHCKFVNQCKNGNGLFGRLFNMPVKPKIITLPVGNSSLLSLNKTFTDKCHILKIPKVLGYMPKLNHIMLHHNRKMVPLELDKKDDRYWQDHLFCLSNNSFKLYKYLKDVGYDIDISSQIHQILYRCYHKNYNVIWLDGSILSEEQLNHIIYVLRVMYNRKNTIIIMVPSVEKFKTKHDTSEFSLKETESPNFYKFDYMNYICIKKLMKEITYNKDVSDGCYSGEIIVNNKASLKDVAKYLNNKFYVGCDIIKSDFKHKHI